MNKINRNLLLTLILIVIVGISNCYSQTEEEKINNLIEQKLDYNKNNKNSAVFKIQLYNGNEQEAYKTKQNFTTEYPEYSTDIIYDAPEWKTHVGKFKTRLEADKVLKIIQENFTGAIVLETEI